jgi:hypothetical protein
MILGFAGIGFMTYRKRKNGLALRAASSLIAIRTPLKLS